MYKKHEISWVYPTTGQLVWQTTKGQTIYPLSGNATFFPVRMPAQRWTLQRNVSIAIMSWHVHKNIVMWAVNLYNEFDAGS